MTHRRAGRSRRDADDRGREAPSRFPGTQADSLAEAPPRCRCGAPWASEDGGLACRLCGRRLYVTTELRRLVERYGFGRVTVVA